MLQRPDVVDSAIAAEIERHRSSDVLTIKACDQDVVGGGVGAAEEVGRHKQFGAPLATAQEDRRPTS